MNRLKEKPSDADLLELYGLYKQATVGNVNVDRPGGLNFKAKAKWDSWNDRKDTDSKIAKQEYVNKAEELIRRIGIKSPTNPTNETAGAGASDKFPTVSLMTFASFFALVSIL